jgi:hypothetical protein
MHQFRCRKNGKGNKNKINKRGLQQGTQVVNDLSGKFTKPILKIHIL